MSSNDSNSSTPTSPEQTKLTVPNVDAGLVGQDTGDSMSRTSSSSSGSGSQCSSLFFSEGSDTSASASENDTPPETPGEGRGKVYCNTSSDDAQDTYSQPTAEASDLVVHRPSKGLLSNSGSSTTSRRSLFRTVSEIVSGVKNLGASGSHFLKRGIYPPSLEMPPPNQTGPFTTSPHGSSYGSPVPRAHALQSTLDDIQEGSREGSEVESEASHSRRETPSGTPGVASAAQPIVFVYTPPAEEQVAPIFRARSPLSPPAAPVLMPVHLPEALQALNLSDIISPMSSLPTPLHLVNGVVVQSNPAVNVGNYNPYFAAVDHNDLD